MNPQESETEETLPEAPVGEVALKAEIEKYKDIILRARADFDNFRKRAQREKEDSIRYANSALLEKLLPLLDNFELGLDAAKSAADAAGILQGMAMVQKQFQDFLREQGVEPIESVGTPFDTSLHEAVASEPSDEIAEGIVIRQLRKGYKLKDRLLRPASVMVSRGKA